MSEDFTVHGRVVLNDGNGGFWGPSLGRMRQDFDRAFTRIGNSFRDRLLNAVSAGGIAFLITRVLNKGQEVSKESGRLGVTVEQMQTLQRLADRTGYSVDELAEKLRDASNNGGDLLSNMEQVVDELRDAGLLIPEDQVQALAEAFAAIADVMTKATIMLGGLVKNLNEGMTGIANRGFWSSVVGGAKVAIGSVYEAAGKYTGNERMQTGGLEMQLRGYGVTPADSDSDSSPSGGASALADLVKRLREQRELDLWWKSIGGDVDWSSRRGSKAVGSAKAEVSDLRRMGGYMSPLSGVSSDPSVEQLRLLNRKMTDLIAGVRRLE